MADARGRLSPGDLAAHDDLVRALSGGADQYRRRYKRAKRENVLLRDQLAAALYELEAYDNGRDPRDEQPAGEPAGPPEGQAEAPAAAGRLSVRRADLSDPAWVRANGPELLRHTTMGTVDYFD